MGNNEDTTNRGVDLNGPLHKLKDTTKIEAAEASLSQLRDEIQSRYEDSQRSGEDDPTLPALRKTAREAYTKLQKARHGPRWQS